MFEARKQKLKAFLVAEKLIIGDKSYTIHTLNTLHTTLDLTKAGIVKVTDDITAFYGSLSYLSNFTFSQFINNRGICFHSSEQFVQHSKAILFDYPSSTDKILAAKTPGECKFLGNQVQNINFDTWKLHAKDIMKQGLCLKFSQNKNCFDALEATGKSSLVEASSTDMLWGVGLGLQDPNLKKQQNRKGANWMGRTNNGLKYYYDLLWLNYLFYYPS